jgi:hypothetical protein
MAARKTAQEGCPKTRGKTPRTKTGKEDHIGGPVLETRSVVRQEKHGPCCAVADQADPRPEEERPSEPIAAGRDEEYALTGSLLNAVDGLLNGRAVVGLAVCVDGKAIGGEVDGL